jgi:hypothetical protein
MVLRAMVLGWMVGLFTSIHERVLYPSHRPGGEGNDIVRGRKPPPPLFVSDSCVSRDSCLVVLMFRTAPVL